MPLDKYSVVKVLEPCVLARRPALYSGPDTTIPHVCSLNLTEALSGEEDSVVIYVLRPGYYVVGLAGIVASAVDDGYSMNELEQHARFCRHYMQLITSAALSAVGVSEGVHHRCILVDRPKLLHSPVHVGDNELLLLMLTPSAGLATHPDSRLKQKLDNVQLMRRRRRVRFDESTRS